MAKRIRRNPTTLPSIEELADHGYGEFEDYYPKSARGGYADEPYDRYYGRNVIWLGEDGAMVRVGRDFFHQIDGNIFDPDKLAAMIDGVENHPDRVEVVAPVVDASLVGPLTIGESIAYAEYDDLDRPLSTGDDELDEYLAEKANNRRYRDREMEAVLKEAVEEEWGDLGEWQFQIRDGNHRAFGAIIAGEPYFYAFLYANTLQDAREGRTARDRALREILE